jgi:hypothetical protein
MISVYKNESISLTSKHMKELAIQDVMRDMLGAYLNIVNLDTDTLGTFTGEVERAGSPRDVVVKKCLWGLEHTNSNIGIASEGTFGPHPYLPFCACDHEILMFIDKRYNFELAVSTVTENTNYDSKLVSHIDDLLTFAYRVGFPTHGLILSDDKKINIKGITDEKILLQQFHTMQVANNGGPILVQTDMRAHMNPTRMSVIRETAEKLCYRLLSLCPSCSCPGWGLVDRMVGLPCEQCGEETGNIKAEIYGCVRCSYRETLHCDADKLDWWYCNNCNP